MNRVKIDFSLRSDVGDSKPFLCKVVSYFLITVAVKIMLLTTHYCAGSRYLRKPFKCFNIGLAASSITAEFRFVNITDIIIKTQLSKPWCTIELIPCAFCFATNIDKEFNIVYLQ